jgi:hypothetical protein
VGVDEDVWIERSGRRRSSVPLSVQSLQFDKFTVGSHVSRNSSHVKVPHACNHESVSQDLPGFATRILLAEAGPYQPSGPLPPKASWPVRQRFREPGITTRARCKLFDMDSKGGLSPVSIRLPTRAGELRAPGLVKLGDRGQLDLTGSPAGFCFRMETAGRPTRPRQ